MVAVCIVTMWINYFFMKILIEVECEFYWIHLAVLISMYICTNVHAHACTYKCTYLPQASVCTCIQHLWKWVEPSFILILVSTDFYKWLSSCQKLSNLKNKIDFKLVFSLSRSGGKVVLSVHKRFFFICR